MYRIAILFLTILSYTNCFRLDAQTQMGSDILGTFALALGSVTDLSSDGKIIAVGAIGGSYSSNFPGLVRVYYWDDSDWVQMGNELFGKESGDNFGKSLSMSSDGKTLAIGAPGSDGITGENCGIVSVYSWAGAEWVQKGFDIHGERAWDASGWSISLSDDANVLAIGAPGNMGITGIGSGHVRIYSWDGSTWIQQGKDIDGEKKGDGSGYTVELSNDGSVIAIGSTDNSDNGYRSGQVRAYSWNGTSWVKRGSDLNGDYAWDYSGGAISMSSDGTVLAIGAHENDVNGFASGHVKVFRWTGQKWLLLGNEIGGEKAGDISGSAVSLSADGSIIAIGSPLNSDEKFRSGCVRVYTWDGLTWEKTFSNIYGVGEFDYSGSAVSLSDDGKILAIGAPNYTNIGLQSGQVRIFNLNPLNASNLSPIEDIVCFFPNPCSDHIVLSCSSAIESVWLHNSQGQLILKETFENDASKEIILDVTILHNGLFYATVKTALGVSVKKLIKAN